MVRDDAVLLKGVAIGRISKGMLSLLQGCSSRYYAHMTVDRAGVASCKVKLRLYRRPGHAVTPVPQASYTVKTVSPFGPTQPKATVC